MHLAVVVRPREGLTFHYLGCAKCLVSLSFVDFCTIDFVEDSLWQVFRSRAETRTLPRVHFEYQESTPKLRIKWITDIDIIRSLGRAIFASCTFTDLVTVFCSSSSSL
jgi:hypothetical protein